MVDSIEGPLVRVPFEAFKRTTRNRKYLLDELEHTLIELETQAAHGQRVTHEHVSKALDYFLERFQGLKRKVDEIGVSEAADAHRVRARLEHLQTLGLPGKEQVLSWQRKRMDRLLVDYLLRAGHMHTAQTLTTASNTQDLVDTHLFEAVQPVIEALRKRDCQPALHWCSQHATRLKKSKSKLEFKLRVQEFVELVRADKQVEAIAYARQHLAPWASTFLDELQRAMALLAVARNKQLYEPYKQLLDPRAWDELEELFRKEVYRLHNMTPVSLLELHLEAGLSSLKTPKSFEEGSTKEDPLHHAPFKQLAQRLPFSKHVHSKLLCSITREIMNEHNPPMALPNGNVYSEKAIMMVAAQNSGTFIDPHTNEAFTLSDVRRAYIS